ncbi:MAG: hypothetical protein Q7R50_02555 [Dehalococcoidales bacterium]|nr:hypothetical protein [Dehalococcoidales bacterium]
MSVRAYRVVRVLLADPSFNVSHDQKLVNFIESESEAGFYSYLNSYGSGEVDVPVNVLKKAVKKAKQLNLDEFTVNSLKEDIAFAKARKDESVTYSCF